MKAWTTKHWSKATLVGMIGLFALAGPVRAGSAESRFADGNRAWLAGDYAGAIQCYEAIAQQEGISPGLLHHLARAYQASIRVSPYAAAREVTVVSQGNTLTVIGSHGAFLKVRTADGQTGWMAATHISRLTGLDFTIPEHGAEVVSAGNRARDAGSEG